MPTRAQRVNITDEQHAEDYGELHHPTGHDPFTPAGIRGALEHLVDELAQFSPPGRELEPTILIERGGVTVWVAGPQHMLAMKLRAARGRRDETDIEALLDRCGIRSLAAAEELFERYYPDVELKELAVAVIERHVKD